MSDFAAKTSFFSKQPVLGVHLPFVGGFFGSAEPACGELVEPVEVMLQGGFCCFFSCLPIDVIPAKTGAGVLNFFIILKIILIKRF